MIRVRSRQKQAAVPDTQSPEVYPVEEPGPDHGLRLEGETCARCGRDIRAGEECRRTLQGDCVHLDC